MSPKKLLIDAGNTRVKVAQMDADGHLEPLFNLPYDELNSMRVEATFDAVWLALVGGGAQQTKLQEWLHRECQPAKLHTVASEASRFGVRSAYQEPTHLGVDRWLAMLGAYNEIRKPTLIVDAGTAITVDWIDGEGQHLGGWIAPGVDLMQRAVVDRAPRVFTHETDSMWGRANKLGTSTPDGLMDGCVNMFAGIVRQALYVTETEFDWFDFRLLFSGGSTPLLPVELKRRGELRSELVLQGLALYARKG